MKMKKIVAVDGKDVTLASTFVNYQYDIFGVNYWFTVMLAVVIPY